MLANFNTKFSSVYREAAKKSGYSVDDIIILASIIQGEGKYVADYGQISSVFYNRMHRSRPDVRNGYLQSDATILYTFADHREVYQEDLTIVSPYNTYENPGLPPGPIGNPSLNAISYALEPDNTNYFFFISGLDGKTYFAETAEEHELNKATYRGR